MKKHTPQRALFRFGWIGALAALTAPSVYGIPLAIEDFTGYTVAAANGKPALIGQTDSKNPINVDSEDWNPNRGWNGQWYMVEANQWWPSSTIEATQAAYMAKDNGFINQGNAWRSGGGRMVRKLLDPKTTGVYYTAFTMDIADVANISDNQIWVTYGESDNPYANPADTEVKVRAYNAVAGLRNLDGKLAYFATNIGKGTVTGDDPTTVEVETEYQGWLPPEEGNADQAGGAGEVYVTLKDAKGNPVEQKAPGTYLYVMKTDLSASPAKISYYVFAPGVDVSNVANATAKVENLDLAAARTAGIDAMAVFTVLKGVRVSNLRIAPSYEEAVLLTNGTVVAPMARTAPTLDGEIDAQWADVPSNPIAKIHDGKTIPESDLKGSFKAVWDAENLYVLVEVQDDDLIKFNENVHPEKNTVDTGYLNDEFEFFTDGGLDRTVGPGWPTAYDTNDMQWVFRPGNDGFFSGFAQDWQYNGWANINGDILGNKPEGWGAGATVVGKIAEDGKSYVAEVKFPWTALALQGSAAVGKMLGFEMQLNDRDGRDTTGLALDGDKYIWPSDGKKAYADGNNTAWRQSNGLGTLLMSPALDPVVEDTYEGYSATDVVGEDGGLGWGTPWQIVWQAPWAGATPPWKAVDAFMYPGDFEVGPDALAKNGAGVRIGRKFAAEINSGVSYLGFSVKPGAGSFQFWLTKTQDAEPADGTIDNSNVGLVAGIRQDGGKPIEFIDVKVASETAPETYVPITGAVYNDPYVVVVAINHTTKDITYHVFGPGNTLASPASADFIKTVKLGKTGPSTAFDGVILTQFGSDTVLGPIRVGDDLSQVLPRPAVDPMVPVLANKLPAGQTVAVDGTLEPVWQATKAAPINRFWSDGDKNVPASSAADYSANSHLFWEGTTLHVAIPVKDDDVRDGADKPDAIELYLDGDDSNHPSLGWPTNYDQVDDFQLIFTLDGTAPEGVKVEGPASWNPTGNPFGYKATKDETNTFDGIVYKVTKTADGYLFEASLDLSKLFAAGVPEGESFVMPKLIGYDAAVVDHDAAGEAVEKTHNFLSDTTNSNWNGTAMFGTAYLVSAPPVFYTLSKASESVAAEGASGLLVGVTANQDYMAWTATTEASWIMLDVATGQGNGDIEYSVQANAGAKSRSGAIKLGASELAVSQAGLGVAGFMAAFPDSDFVTDAAAAWYNTKWFGNVYTTTADFPWAYHAEHGWQYVDASSLNNVIYVYDQAAGWLYTTKDLYPVLYAYGFNTWVYYALGTKGPRWFYAYGSNSWVSLP